jgi:hypothetical protein
MKWPTLGGVVVIFIAIGAELTAASSDVARSALQPPVGGAAASAPVAAKQDFSLIDYSQRLLRIKPELCLFDLTQQGRCEGIKDIADGVIAASDSERRIAQGLVNQVFPAAAHQKMLGICTRREIATRNNASAWVNNGRVGAQEHDFKANLIVEPAANSKPYIEKVFVNPDETLICMGDLHGSLHSLLRNLWHMVECNQLKDDFTLAPNHRLIFLGDLVDRGVYGTETILLLLCLLWKNPGRVHLARGNHEDIDGAKDFAFNAFGFLDEINLKFPTVHERDYLIALYESFFLSLPHALFIGVGDEASRWWMECAHGGFDPFIDVRAFLGLDAISAVNSTKRFAWVESVSKDASHIRPPEWRLAEGLNWTDVTGVPSESSFSAVSGVWNANTKRSGGVLPGAGVCASIEQLNDYLQASGLKALVRGHQDMWSCVKVLMNGLHEPQSWRVHPAFADYTPARIFTEGFYPSRFFPCDGAQTTPCFTCTTAGEGKGTLNDGYLIIRCAARYEDTIFQVYENHLSQATLKATVQETLRLDAATTLPADLKTSRHGKFVTIVPRAGRYNDAYAPGVDAAAAAATAMHRWVEEPDQNPIHPALIDCARKPFVSVAPPAASAVSASGSLAGNKRNASDDVLGAGGSAAATTAGSSTAADSALSESTDKP